MPIPTQDATTSVLAWTRGVPEAYQPAASPLASVVVTATASTDLLNFADDNAEFADDDRVRIIGDTIPAPLEAGVDYYVRDYATSNECKLALTAGGAAIDITGDGVDLKLVRADTWDADGLPSGVSIDPVLGLISGIPDARGVFVVLIRCRNASGVSADREIAIGIVNNFALDDGSVPVDIDVLTGRVRVSGFALPAAAQDAGASTSVADGGVQLNITNVPSAATVVDASEEAAASAAEESSGAKTIFEERSGSAAPVLHVKSGDQFPLALGFVQSGRLVDVALSSLLFGVKELDSEPVALLNDNTWDIRGAADNVRFVTVIDLTSEEVTAMVDNHADEDGTFVDVLAEIEYKMHYQVAGGPLQELRKTTLSFIMRIHRELIPNE